MNKPKVIKDFTKLPEDIQEEILQMYPNGYQEFLILFTDKDGKYASGLPYETEERSYLLRMPKVNLKVKAIPDEEEEENIDETEYGDLDTMKVGGDKVEDEDEYD